MSRNPEPSDPNAAIRSDDAFLDVLGGRMLRAEQVSADTAHGELNALLLGWRREVDSRPVDPLVSTAEALHVIKAARRRVWWRRVRTAVLIAVAIVAVVTDLYLAFGGLR